MLKVLLVDDEPFILQGLQVLIDWEKEGYEIATAVNGREALEYALENEVDLIISDIKMPVMTGLELLKAIRTTYKRETYFVILSGFAEFGYAQEAMRYDCTDYILKPVEKDQLLAILKNVAALSEKKSSQSERQEKQEKAYLDRNLMALLGGKYDSDNLEYLSEKINIDESMSYIGIQLDVETMADDYSDEEKKAQLKKLYAAAVSFLKENADLCIMDVSDSEKVYDIGVIYCESMAEKKQLTFEKYLKEFIGYIKDNTNLPVTMLVGKMVSGIKNISKSY
ncbi:MAG: response regulator, partial [Lachnospiraceae bacterium]|nr:response regulator [Lachnospiraceae bacterium]